MDKYRQLQMWFDYTRGYQLQHIVNDELVARGLESTGEICAYWEDEEQPMIEEQELTQTQKAILNLLLMMEPERATAISWRNMVGEDPIKLVARAYDERYATDDRRLDLTTHISTAAWLEAHLEYDEKMDAFYRAWVKIFDAADDKHPWEQAMAFAEAVGGRSLWGGGAYCTESSRGSDTPSDLDHDINVIAFELDDDELGFDGAYWVVTSHERYVTRVFRQTTDGWPSMAARGYDCGIKNWDDDGYEDGGTSGTKLWKLPCVAYDGDDFWDAKLQAHLEWAKEDKNAKKFDTPANKRLMERNVEIYKDEDFDKFCLDKRECIVVREASEVAYFVDAEGVPHRIYAWGDL